MVMKEKKGGAKSSTEKFDLSVSASDKDKYILRLYITGSNGK